MISRCLGLEFGGSIGTLFFLANVVGSGLAITGCAEGFIENFGVQYGLLDGRWWRFFYCTMINLMILMVVLIGAGLFAKTSVIILGVVIVCLLSTLVSFIVKGPQTVLLPIENTYANATNASYTGLSMDTFISNLNPNYGKDYSSDGQMVNFAITFGVLFSGKILRFYLLFLMMII